MDMDRYIGRLLDNRYEILEVIGVGGMALFQHLRKKKKEEEIVEE